MNLIWIHGFGENGNAWKTIIPLINPMHNSFIFQHCYLENKNHISDYAEELRQFIIANDIDQPILIGHSMGGYIALEYAHMFSNDIAGLGLFHSTSKADTEAKKHERDKTKILIKKHGSSVFLKAFYPNMFTSSFKDKNVNLIEERIIELSQISPLALCSSAEAMKNRNDHTDNLSSYTFPIFQILGKQDLFVPIEDAFAQTSKMQKPNVLLSSEMAHGGMYENPEACAHFINDFLKSNYTL